MRFLRIRRARPVFGATSGGAGERHPETLIPSRSRSGDRTLDSTPRGAAHRKKMPRQKGPFSYLGGLRHSFEYLLAFP